MVMVFVRSMRGHAPLVAYEDYFQFADMCERMHDAYRELIAKAVYLRRKHAPQCESAFSQRTVMLMGQAEFHDVRVGGMRILMRLTKGKGFRFCCNLNEDIINALATSSRTYVHTILRLCLLNTDITFRINLEDMMIGMRDAVVQLCGHCDAHTGRIGADLFHANFIAWGAPEDAQKTFCPLSRLPEYVTAFAMSGHDKLCTRKGVLLSDDVLRQICAYLV